MGAERAARASRPKRARARRRHGRPGPRLRRLVPRNAQRALVQHLRAGLNRQGYSPGGMPTRATTTTDARTVLKSYEHGETRWQIASRPTPAVLRRSVRQLAGYTEQTNG